MKALQDYFQEILMDSSSSSLVLVHDNAISHYDHHHYYCCCKLCNPSCCSSTTSSNLSSSFHGSRHTPQDWLMETAKNIPNGDDSSCSSRNNVYTNLPSFVLSPKRNDSPSSNGRNRMEHETSMVGMMRKPKRLVSFPLSHQNCRGAGGGGGPFFPHNNNESPFASPTKTSPGDGNGACPTTRPTLSSSLSLSTSSSSCNVNHQEDNNRRLTMSGYYDCGIHNNHSKIMNNNNNNNKDTRWSPILPLKQSLLFHHHHSKEADSSSSPPISPKRRRSLETILDEVLVLGEMM